MPRVVCMASVKGGSGKTVMSATFGTFLAATGQRVLLVDTDAATNGLTLLYLHEVMLRREEVIHERRHPTGLLEDGTSADVVALGPNLDLIPASFALSNTEGMPLSAFEPRLNRLLDDARASYDFIFLDAQAGSEEFSAICMDRDVSDEVVIVSEYDPMSAAGVERLKAAFPDQLAYPRTWILLNKMLPEFVYSFSDFLEVARYLSPIPWDADVVRAYATRRLALDLEGANEYTLAVFRALRSLLGAELRKQLDAWLADQATLLRAPIEQRLLETKYEIEEVYERERLWVRKRTVTIALGAAALAASLTAITWVLLQRPIFGSAGSSGWSLLVIAVLAIATGAFSVLTRRLELSPKERDMNRRRLDALFDSEQILEGLVHSDAEILLRERKTVERDLQNLGEHVAAARAKKQPR